MVKFKVTLEVEGEKYDMIVSFEGKTASVEFQKDGKQVKNYESIPVEILSQIPKEEPKDEEPEVVEVVDDEDIPEVDSPFDALYDLEDFIMELEHSIECPELLKRLRPIIKRNFSKIDDICTSLTTGITEADYEPAAYALKIGFNDLSVLSSTFVTDLGGLNNKPGSEGNTIKSGLSSLITFKPPVRR